MLKYYATVATERVGYVLYRALVWNMSAIFISNSYAHEQKQQTVLRSQVGTVHRLGYDEKQKALFLMFMDRVL